MQLHIKIDNDILKKFGDQLETQIDHNRFVIPEKWGSDTAERMSFDGDVEFVSI